MSRFADWLWGRYRRNYLWAAGSVLLVFAVVVLAVPFSVIVGAGVRATGDQIVRGAISIAVAFGLSGVAFVALMDRKLRSVTAWARGESDDIAGAWRSGIDLPRLINVYGAAIYWPFDHLFLVPMMARIYGMTTKEFIGVQLCTFFVELTLLTIVAFGARLFITPVAREISLKANEPLQGRRDVSLNARIAIAVFAAAAASAMTTGALVRLPAADEDAILLLFGVSGGLALYVTVFVLTGIVQPAVEPLRDLREATQRVANGNFTERVPVTSVDDLGDLAVSFNEMQQGLHERESLHAAFGSYVDPALAERLLGQTDSTFEGEDVEVSVFFADVRDFTAYSSRTAARDAVARLNRLFALAVPIIRDHGGHANKYIGDAVLAVFGTPQPLVNHADHAVTAAVEIQRALFDEFGESLRIGIGLNTGRAIAGTIGGGGKLEFTVIGDTVNVASRIETLTKETGDPILLTQATLDALTTAPTNLVDRGLFDVRGKDEKLRVHGLRP